MNELFIFGAKYLFLGSIILSFIYLIKTNRKLDILKFAVFSFPISLIVGKILNLLYYNPRPFVLNNTTPLINHVADNGFPSDHVLLVASLASLFLFFNKKVAILLWIITFLVAISRVYVGVHHILDVVVSALISITVAWMIYLLSKFETNATNTGNEQD